MSLENQIMTEMKEAMKARNEAVLRALRAIKAEIIKAKTDPGAGGEIDEATEQKFLQKMMKQRRDSLEIFEKQGRADLAEKEKEEMAVIERFRLNYNERISRHRSPCRSCIYMFLPTH